MVLSAEFIVPPLVARKTAEPAGLWLHETQWSLPLKRVGRGLSLLIVFGVFQREICTTLSWTLKFLRLRILLRPVCVEQGLASLLAPNASVARKGCSSQGSTSSQTTSSSLSAPKRFRCAAVLFHQTFPLRGSVTPDQAASSARSDSMLAYMLPLRGSILVFVFVMKKTSC